MPDDRCVIRIARSEMGQGTMTGLAQLVVEELECDWEKVSTEFPTPGESLARKRVWGEIGTGGSRGIRTSQDYVRRGGAAARMMLLQAAADEWKVPVAELTVANGVITHAASKRTTSYGKVAVAAAKLPAPDPASIKLKDPKDWKIAGKSMKRLDTAVKLDGSLVYAIDVKLPGMRCAAIKACPVFGGKLVSFDESKIAGRPGSPRAVRVNDTTVAVVADTWWRAKTALEALPIVWDEGSGASQSSATIAAHLKEGLTAPVAYAMRQEGDALKAIAGAAKKVEAVYSTPFLAHATMEPMNCTAKITPERAEVWVATQNGEASLATLSEASGLPLEKCEVYKHILGGGFGRRGGAQDYVRQAVDIAKQFPGVPIKMIWSREEDMTHDFYRPISQCRAAAGLDENGKLVGLHVRVSGQSINAFLNQAAAKDGRDDRQLQGYYAAPGDAQLGYTRAEPADRVRDAQHPRAGRSVARREHQPERRLHGVLHRRGGARRRRRPGRVPPGADAKPSEASRSAERGRGESRLGQASAGGRPSRRRAVHGLRQLFGGGRRGFGERQGQAQGPPDGARGELRPRGQPRPDRGAGRRIGRVRLERDVLRRMHGRQRPHRGDEFPHLRDPAAQGHAEGRDRGRPDVRLLGRRRRADDLRRRARGAERDHRGDGQAGAQACRSSICRWCDGIVQDEG